MTELSNDLTQSEDPATMPQRIYCAHESHLLIRTALEKFRIVNAYGYALSGEESM